MKVFLRGEINSGKGEAINFACVSLRLIPRINGEKKEKKKGAFLILWAEVT